MRKVFIINRRRLDSLPRLEQQQLQLQQQQQQQEQQAEAREQARHHLQRLREQAAAHEAQNAAGLHQQFIQNAQNQDEL